jgi:hypothetical protein
VLDELEDALFAETTAAACHDNCLSRQIGYLFLGIEMHVQDVVVDGYDILMYCSVLFGQERGKERDALVVASKLCGVVYREV